MATETKDMHADLASLADSLIDDCLEQYDGEQCFNLYRYIERLESRIEELQTSAEGWSRELGRFGLEPMQIARYLWACIAIKETGMAYPTKFREMPVLD